MRILHLSDIHIWNWIKRPWDLAGKRLLAAIELANGRAARFRLERVHEVLERVLGCEPDHVLITGDLTTSSLPMEFRQAHEALGTIFEALGPERVTMIPGNHDRYTPGAVRLGRFEKWFGDYMPAPEFPWLRRVDDATVILGLDPTRAHLSAQGKLPRSQFTRARKLLEGVDAESSRLIVACHYPLYAPELHAKDLHQKRMRNYADVADWLRGVGPHLYCCGHVHAAWAFRPLLIPAQLCINAGAPLMRDPEGACPPGFVQIDLDDRDVTVTHHGHVEDEGWLVRPLLPRTPIDVDRAVV